MKKRKNGIFFILDETNSRCGITDRLKAAVGLYHISRINGIDFRFIHRAGFDIRDYLLPNKVDWSAELSDISRIPWEKEKIRYFPPFRDLPDFRPDKQYICRSYIGKNIIEMSGVPDWQRVWREYFWDLFTPSEKVLSAMADNKLPEHYVVINARFINALGRFEDADYNAPFPEETQKKIIETVLAKAEECAGESGVPAIVYSDSVVFLKAAAEKGFRTCDPQVIGHIMNPEAGELVYLHTFVNFFQIAQADKIYSILNPEGIPENSLYKTQYPRYAAVIGDRPFIRI